MSSPLRLPDCDAQEMIGDKDNVRVDWATVPVEVRGKAYVLPRGLWKVRVRGHSVAHLPRWFAEENGLVILSKYEPYEQEAEYDI
jgi:hypothetical protein